MMMLQRFWARTTRFLVLFVCAAPLMADAADRPNIVWLTSEDNSANWYRLYNEHGAPMPNIERLAERGLLFKNAYSCAPVCSTARSGILSGCYVTRLGAHNHRPELKVSFPPGVKAFPSYLRKAGYYTTNNRKTDYNFIASETADAWDESSNKATYRNRKAGQPFFHVQNFGQTHEGQLFGNLPKGVNRSVDPANAKLFPYHPDTPLFREKYAQYLTRQTYVDSLIGKFIDQLEADGLLDDTFIFHYGDHGGVLPGSKGYARNDGLQVAMVVYVPKNWQHLAPAKRGTKIDGFVEFIDLSATVLNLAGIPVPDNIDGRPFLGKGVTLDDLNQRDTTMGYAGRFDEKYDFVRFLRKGNFTYHRSYQPFNFDGLFNEYRYKQPAYREWRDLFKQGKLDAQQAAFFRARAPEALYNLEDDPHEVNNLASDPAYAKVLLEMREMLQGRLKSMPDVGFIPEPVFVLDSNAKGFEFGQKNKRLLAQLIDIADLQLRDFGVAEQGIRAALESDHPMKRYWGLVTCSVFGAKAKTFYGTATKLADSDGNLLVRMRAAEFLGLTGAKDPRPIITDVLKQCKDPVEANLILNTVVLLRDGQPKLEFDFEAVEGAAWFKKKPGIANLVQRRIAQFRKNQR